MSRGEACGKSNSSLPPLFHYSSWNIVYHVVLTGQERTTGERESRGRVLPVTSNQGFEPATVILQSRGLTRMSNKVWYVPKSLFLFIVKLPGGCVVRVDVCDYVLGCRGVMNTRGYYKHKTCAFYGITLCFIDFTSENSLINQN